MSYLVNIANQGLHSKYLLALNILIFINLISLFGDIEEQLGPQTKLSKNLSLCQQKVNSILSHNFQKLAILESFVVLRKLVKLKMLKL